MVGYREVDVAAAFAGMRLDRFLPLRFPGRSRSAFAKALRDGLVRDAADRPLDAAHRLRAGELLRVYVPGIAPGSAPPPFPPVLFEDARVVVLDKPAGLLAHPAGTAWAWAVISLAKARWPDARVDLVHRLDRDTSGVLLLTKDLEANRHLKEAVADGRVHKEYEALTRGVIPWDFRALDGPIGYDDGPVRVKMAVRPDGLPARTDVTVLARGEGLTHVHCRLHTGRTHQIRLHLDHAGYSLVGDRLYGVPPDVFLGALQGVPEALTQEAAGAPRHALHARRVTFPHPDGPEVVVEAPFPADLASWWADPAGLRDRLARAAEEARGYPGRSEEE